MANSSYVFNGQSIPLSVSINNGAYKPVAGTDATANWVPSSATVAFTPLEPARGNLQWGKNIVQFMPSAGASEPQTYTFQIPETTNIQSQMQIYLFWLSSTQFAVQVLINGQASSAGNQVQSFFVEPAEAGT